MLCCLSYKTRSGVDPCVEWYWSLRWRGCAQLLIRWYWSLRWRGCAQLLICWYWSLRWRGCAQLLIRWYWSLRWRGCAQLLIRSYNSCVQLTFQTRRPPYAPLLASLSSLRCVKEQLERSVCTCCYLNDAFTIQMMFGAGIALSM